MAAAGRAAADAILRHGRDRLGEGVAIHAGPGNNGGDAWVVAALLHRAGVTVRVAAPLEPRTDDARRARALAHDALVVGGSDAPPTGRERVVVDGLLGTGQGGALREPIAAGARAIAAARAHGACVVALDLPTGVAADDGAAAEGAVRADLTLAFGTLKRAHLVARHHMGRLLLLDIGLGAHAHLADDAWALADGAALGARLAPIAWDAHKGRRGHLAVVGGAVGMAGAVVLAARAAYRAGVGLVKAVVEGPGLAALQVAVPEAIATAWPEGDRPGDDAPPRATEGTPEGSRFGHALAIGPGLGRTARARATLLAWLDANPGVPVVLDADALTQAALAAQAEGTSPAAVLGRWTARAGGVVLTPHPGEFARLIGRTTPLALADRVEAAQALAEGSGATVLLKGTPTIVVAPGEPRLRLVARGTPALAVGGSGDLLTGLVGALLAQGHEPPDAGALAAWAHGAAAELATADARGVRGVTLGEVADALPRAWRALEAPAALPRGVLLDLPAPC
jgi:NAD(P)H-hydrate epimerase